MEKVRGGCGEGLLIRCSKSSTDPLSSPWHFSLALKSPPALLKAPRLAESPCFITPGQGHASLYSIIAPTTLVFMSHCRTEGRGRRREMKEEGDVLTARPLLTRDPKHDLRFPSGRRLTSRVTSLSQDVGPT
ncbi:hypothetical protein E2C01_041372 [Portunus trituberculatus]|uniref:Uncharacterized protein n=1 Tax=Portunus trituberculatus TaxID=210409 RepID=A0A5B7FJ36_PORTR|nr:hypothetical protein [Portunus trituberculatus]